MPPKRSAVAAHIARTASSSATSTANAKASPEHSETVSSASAMSRSATQTFAPSSVKRIAASRPMPPPAPVMTQTFPLNLPMSSALRRDEHALDLRVALERVHAELAAEPRLLEAAERRLHAHRRVCVHGEDAGVGCPRHTQCTGPVARPDRAGEPVRRVVREADRVGFVLERDHGRNRAEDLLARDPVLIRRLDDRARVPVA